MASNYPFHFDLMRTSVTSLLKTLCVPNKKSILKLHFDQKYLCSIMQKHAWQHLKWTDIHDDLTRNVPYSWLRNTMHDWWEDERLVSIPDEWPTRPIRTNPPSGQGSDFCLSVVCRGCERIFTALWNKTHREKTSWTKLTISMKVKWRVLVNKWNDIEVPLRLLYYLRFNFEL